VTAHKGNPLKQWADIELKRTAGPVITSVAPRRWRQPLRQYITLAGIACIIMRKVYPTIGESIYPNTSFQSRNFPEASGRLLRKHKEFTFQDMAN